MAANRIKAGEAYVEVSASDRTKPTFDKVDKNFAALSKSIRRQHDLTAATAAATAAESASEAVRQLQIQKKNVESAIKATKPVDRTKAAKADAQAKKATLEAERATLETRITAAKAQQAKLEEQATAAKAAADQLTALRLLQLQQHTAELQKQRDLQQQATAAGSSAVGNALQAAGKSQRIASISSVKEADAMTAALRSQRGQVDAQAAALMQQLRTMREAKASADSQKVVADAVRDAVAKRRDIEQQINDIQQRRAGIVEAPKVAREAWNKGSSAQTVGLSPATLNRFQLSAAKATESGNQFNRSLSGVNRSGSRTQMVLQGMIYAADDAAASYGTGGIAGALRGAANNISQVASLFGPWAFGMTVAATAAAQLYFAFNKNTKPAEEFRKSIGDINSELAEFSRQAAHAVQLKSALFSKDTQSMREGLGTQLAESSIVTKNLQAELEKATLEANAAAKEKNYREGMVHWANMGVDPRGKVEDARADHAAKEERRAKVQEELNKHLQEEQRIRSQLKETTDKQRRLEEAERGRKNQMIAFRREINEQNREHQKRLDLQRTEIQYRGRLNELIQEQQDALRKEADPHGARRMEVLREYNEQSTRMMLMGNNDPAARQYLAVATRRKMRELDQSDPLRQMGLEMESELDGDQGSRRRAIEQARQRMFELQQELAVTGDPRRAAQIRTLQGGVAKSLAKQLGQISQSSNTANTATDARSTEGIRAMIAATSRDSKTTEQQMLHAIQEGNRLTEEQKKQWDEYLRRYAGAPVLVARSTK